MSLPELMAKIPKMEEEARKAEQRLKNIERLVNQNNALLEWIARKLEKKKEKKYARTH